MAKKVEFDPKSNDYGVFLRTFKPELENAAGEIGKLLADNKYVGPLRAKMDESILKLLSTGIRAGGGWLHLKREWFPTGSSQALANEIVDSLFSGIADAVEKPWKPGEKGVFDRIKFRGEFNHLLNGVNCPVSLDRNGAHYHHPGCNYASKKKQDQLSRIDAEAMGRMPKECCAKWFKYHDERLRFEQPGSLAKAMGELDVEDRRLFQEWLYLLDEEQRSAIKRHLDAVTSKDQLMMILDMVRKHRDQDKILRDEDFLKKSRNEQEHTIINMDRRQWEEMEHWITGMVAPASHDFRTVEGVKQLFREAVAYAKKLDGQINKTADRLNSGPMGKLHDWAKQRRDEALRRRGKQPRRGLLN